MVTFTANKQVVRDYQGKLIAKVFKNRLGNLTYFGLTSPEMKDVRDWLPFFSRIISVERASSQSDYRDQHRVLLTASLCGLDEKLQLLRGDIDEVILSGRDCYGNLLLPPFDVVSLDYSGGLFYRKEDRFVRLEAIKMIVQLGQRKADGFLLFISANCHAVDNGEIKRTLESMRTELNRMQYNGDKLFHEYMKHPSDVMRLAVFVPYFVRMVAAASNCQTTTYPTITYPGNREIEMLSFRLLVRPTGSVVAPRVPQERLNQIMQTPLIRLEKGKTAQSPFRLPKLERRQSSNYGLDAT